MRTARSVFLTLCVALLASPAGAFDSGSDGSDGAFEPVVSTTVDLSLAGTGPGYGTYDPDLWVVVFNYTDISIPAGVTIDFVGHPSGAPVVWLASGWVVIEGTIDLDGNSATPGPSAVAGPGGFPGGGHSPRTRGFGPGGAGYPTQTRGSGGSYGTPGEYEGGSTVYPPYGNEQILPLIGGSGGAPAGSIYSYRGGDGGGAILIAASGTLILDGTILARGGSGYGPSSTFGSGGGSGGAIRLLATTLHGGGNLSAIGGSPTGPAAAAGGVGRIRLEAEIFNPLVTSSPDWTYDLSPGPIFQDTTTPAVRITTIDGQPVNSDPEAGLDTVDHLMGATGAVDIGIEANNVPTGTTVTLHVVPENAHETNATSTPLVGSLALSTATVSFEFASLRNSEIYLEVDW